MIVGKPDAGQLNALATLNIRGERSVTCKGEFDRHPSLGDLPPGAPPVCEMFRHYPDALERAAELDAQYGTNPPFEEMPMYGVVFSFKDPFDTKDMRTTGGGDAAYDIDFPARDHILVEQLRDKGAIIFAKAVCTEYNGRAGNPGGRHQPDKVLPSVLGYQRSSWGGNPANVYDTTRAASLGSSSGSAVSVSANLVMASLGEETRASTRGPANHNSCALILPHKAMLGFDGGAIGADIYCDRSGIICRTIADCARVLDALKDPETGYYDPRDPYTTVPRSSVLEGGYARHAAAPAASLKGMRIGIVRELMLVRPGEKATVPITTAAAAEIKAVLGDKLGATLVEIVRSAMGARPRPRTDEPGFPRRARAARAGVHARPPVPARARRHAALQGVRRRDPADRVPAGENVRRGTMAPIDYMVELAEGRIAPPANLDIATIQDQELAMSFRFHIPQYLTRRAADWAARGFTETLTDFAALNAPLEILGRRRPRRVPQLGGGDRPAQPARRPAGGRRADHAARAVAPARHAGDVREPARRAGAAAHAAAAGQDRRRPTTRWPAATICGPKSFYGPNAGLTEVLIPAGYVTTAYDPVFRLSDDRMRYVSGRLPTRRPRSRRRACRSRWCSAPSPAAKIWC